MIYMSFKKYTGNDIKQHFFSTVRFFIMLITSDLIRGHTETIILAQLLRKDSYGYEINKTILEKTEGKYELKEATLYTAFRRMEKAQLIRSYWGDETTGARRRYYSITEQGKTAYLQSRQDWENAKTILDRLIRNE